jgi:hypothetical protein
MVLNVFYLFPGTVIKIKQLHPCTKEVSDGTTKQNPFKHIQSNLGVGNVLETKLLN